MKLGHGIPRARLGEVCYKSADRSAWAQHSLPRRRRSFGGWRHVRLPWSWTRNEERGECVPASAFRFRRAPAHPPPTSTRPRPPAPIKRRATGGGGSGGGGLAGAFARYAGGLPHQRVLVDSPLLARLAVGVREHEHKVEQVCVLPLACAPSTHTNARQDAQRQRACTHAKDGEGRRVSGRAGGGGGRAGLPPASGLMV